MSQTKLEQNLRKAYNEIENRAWKCIENPTDVSLQWAQAYHDAAQLIAAAFITAGVPLTEEEVYDGN